MRPTQILILVCMLVLAASLLAVPGGAVDDGQDEESSVEAEADAILIEIDVDEDGDATWRVEHRIRLATESDETAFEEMAEDIEANPTEYEERYAERMGAAAATAADRTDRPMAIEDVTVSTSKAEIPERYGIVTYEFHWTGFAATEGNEIRMGDAIEGMFLDDRMVLIMSWPESHGLESISPTPDEERSSSVVWRGPRDFGSGHPSVVVADGLLGTVDRSAVTLFLPALIAAVALMVVLYHRRPSRSHSPASSTEETDTEDVDLSLLSNEEQVVRVLEDHGGRMKQKELAETLDWTAAKTSQVTGDLREKGTIEGFRLGRENVLKLPDAEDELP